MRFWDSSALVPLCVVQPASERVHALFREDPDVIVWWGSVVEIASGIARLRREGGLDPSGEQSAFEALRALEGSWHEVQPTDVLRRRAERLLRVHPLHAADALQLAAALVWAGDPPEGEIARPSTIVWRRPHDWRGWPWRRRPARHGAKNPDIRFMGARRDTGDRRCWVSPAGAPPEPAASWAADAPGRSTSSPHPGLPRRW